MIEGFHGVRYDAPIARTREVVEICRRVWRRERLQYEGKHYTVPLPADQGTGLGKALKLINQPVRERIPVLLAALGPKNVELAAEIAEGWQPIFFLPEKAATVWGDALKAGKTKRDPALGELNVYAGPVLAIGDNVEPLREFVKPHLALYIGGMGAKGKNFYHSLATSYGYGAEATASRSCTSPVRKTPPPRPYRTSWSATSTSSEARGLSENASRPTAKPVSRPSTSCRSARLQRTGCVSSSNCANSSSSLPGSAAAARKLTGWSRAPNDSVAPRR